MANIFGFFGSILGYVLWAAFYFLKDFGLSIVVFTIVIRLILFPFTVKQQKSMAGTRFIIFFDKIFYCKESKKSFRKNTLITRLSSRRK